MDDYFCCFMFSPEGFPLFILFFEKQKLCEKRSFIFAIFFVKIHLFKSLFDFCFLKNSCVHLFLHFFLKIHLLHFFTIFTYVCIFFNMLNYFCSVFKISLILAFFRNVHIFLPNFSWVFLWEFIYLKNIFIWNIVFLYFFLF